MLLNRHGKGRMKVLPGKSSEDKKKFPSAEWDLKSKHLIFLCIFQTLAQVSFSHVHLVNLTALQLNGKMAA